MHNRRVLLACIFCLAALCIDYFANTKGLWYVTFLVGLCLACLPFRANGLITSSLAASVLGWFLPLLQLSAQYDMRSSADAITAVMGFGINLWWVSDAITIVTGLLLGLAGTWFGVAVRALVFSHYARPGTPSHKQTATENL